MKNTYTQHKKEANVTYFERNYRYSSSAKRRPTIQEQKKIFLLLS